MSEYTCELGKVRENNEDTLALDDDMGYWIVADGMGGHACGEVASQMATEIVSEMLLLGKSSREAVLTAHKAILDRAKKDHDKFGMGTTIVVATKTTNQFDITWCGDSRAYLFDGALKQITYDHTLVQDMVVRKILSREEANVHPKRNLINSSLGMTSGRFRLDVEKIAPSGEGYLLLCSDGVSDYVSHSELEVIFQNNSELGDIYSALRSAVLATEAADNFSYIIIKYKVSSAHSLLNRVLR